MIRHGEREWMWKEENSADFDLRIFGRRKEKREKSFRFFCFRFVVSLLMKSEILPKWAHPLPS